MKSTILVAAALAALAATPALAQEGGRPLTATLSGANGGDAAGSGTASFRVNPGQNQVCYELSVSGIESTMAHIHKGAAGQSGGVVVPLAKPDANGKSSGCATTNGDVAKELIQNPDQYYVNVHTAKFPGGAIRGQLSK